MTAPLLDFAVSTDPDGTTVLHVCGEVDIATAEQLRERLLAEFARHDRLVVDLSRAMLYDGVALRALRALHREAVRARRQPPALRGVRPTLAKVLKATGIHALFLQQEHHPFPSRKPQPQPRPALAASAA
ncbi:MAG TPA: STAS domain-containing protein [Actinocrinis sp.]|uniref:STAS domain-containing protein n=1 Tax=Actinocrinis sp. TaxID=1920516 RepID=UPI002D292E26|nr:STAS domain-containing protein [Actinocrinis sp.]HZU54750.1 STAS domain-containing protein [Actinocrinis sp.]